MKNVKVSISLFCILLGIITLLYPMVNRWIQQNNTDVAIKNYGSDQDYSELYKEFQNYNNDLYNTGQSELKDPFSYEMSDFDLKSMGLYDEVLGYLICDSIDLKLPIYLGASKSNMSKGAALMSKTSIPIGGKNTNAVFASHRDMTTVTLFNNLTQLNKNDIIKIKILNETLKYHVVGTEIVEPTDISKILIQNDKDMITLVTCHPFGTSKFRYIVYCERN
ncbi:class C sortase [Amedibacillus sp. YH-ame6]